MVPGKHVALNPNRFPSSCHTGKRVPSFHFESLIQSNWALIFVNKLEKISPCTLVKEKVWGVKQDLPKCRSLASCPGWREQGLGQPFFVQLEFEQVFHLLPHLLFYKVYISRKTAGEPRVCFCLSPHNPALRNTFTWMWMLTWPFVLTALIGSVLVSTSPFYGSSIFKILKIVSVASDGITFGISVFYGHIVKFSWGVN